MNLIVVGLLTVAFWRENKKHARGEKTLESSGGVSGLFSLCLEL